MDEKSARLANDVLSVAAKVSALGLVHLAVCIGVLWWLGHTWLGGFVGIYCVPIVIGVLWKWSAVMTWRVAETIERREMPDSMFGLWYGKRGVRLR